MLDGRQAQLYFRVYKALVGAAYIQSRGGERTYALLRAWSYYARPLVDCLWEEDANPVAVLTAHDLIGWLWGFRALEDPEAFFKSMCPTTEPTQSSKFTVREDR